MRTSSAIIAGSRNASRARLRAQASSLEGYQTEKEDPNGNVIYFRYNGEGNLSEVELPTGHMYEFTYNLEGYLESIEDPAGRVTQFVMEYTGDENANLQKINHS